MRRARNRWAEIENDGRAEMPIQLRRRGRTYQRSAVPPEAFPPRHWRAPEALPSQGGCPEAFPPQHWRAPEAFPPQGRCPEAFPLQRWRAPEALLPKAGVPEENLHARARRG